MESREFGIAEGLIYGQYFQITGNYWRNLTYKIKVFSRGYKANTLRRSRIEGNAQLVYELLPEF